MNMLSSTAARSFASSTTTVHESRPTSEYNKEIDLELDSPGLELDDFSIPATPTVTTGTRPRSMTTERVLASLPPADQGREAYLFLFAALVVETVIWGFSSGAGTFLQYYTLKGVGKDGNMSGASLLPLVGSFSSGLMYLFGPLVSYTLNPRPRWRIPAMWIGAVVCCLSLLLSSFATQPWHLLMTQGILYSLGGSYISYPAVWLLSEWFVARRGAANGVVFMGTALGGLVYPLLLNYLLYRFDAAIALQILSGATALILLISVPFLKPRLPSSISYADLRSRRQHVAGAGLQQDPAKFYKNKRLMVFSLANFAQSLGYFIPTLFLPTFAVTLGLGTSLGNGLIAATNGSSLLSRVLVGYFSDRVSPHKLAAWTLAASTVCVAVLWGGSGTSLAPLLVFALMLGIVAGGWTSIYPSIAQNVARDDPQAQASLFALACFTRGVGSLLTAPISTLLLDHPMSGVSSHTGFGVDSGRYGSLILFAGASLFVATLMELWVAFS